MVDERAVKGFNFSSGIANQPCHVMLPHAICHGLQDLWIDQNLHVKHRTFCAVQRQDTSSFERILVKEDPVFVQEGARLHKDILANIRPYAWLSAFVERQLRAIDVRLLRFEGNIEIAMG